MFVVGDQEHRPRRCACVRACGGEAGAGAQHGAAVRDSQGRGGGPASAPRVGLLVASRRCPQAGRSGLGLRVAGRLPGGA